MAELTDFDLTLSGHRKAEHGGEQYRKCTTGACDCAAEILRIALELDARMGAAEYRRPGMFRDRDAEAEQKREAAALDAQDARSLRDRIDAGQRAANLVRESGRTVTIHWPGQFAGHRPSCAYRPCSCGAAAR